MPLVRCQNCRQAYDVPPAVAVRLPDSLATCSCGEWLCGSKEALLARFSREGDIEEIDVWRFRVDLPEERAGSREETTPHADTGSPRSVRIIARGAQALINTVFTIDADPLYIGRRGCHVELDDAELSIRHCSITRRGEDLVVTDCDSHTGTYLDGHPVSEAVIAEGVHLVRVGAALVSIETTDQPGMPVGPLSLPEQALETTAEAFRRMREKRAAASSGSKRLVLHCLQGPLLGKELEIPPAGLMIGREGDVRVPDEFLSRRHFAIFRDAEGAVRLRDLGSRNGTFLNTLPAKNTRVQKGDEIRAGNNLFRLEER